MIAVGIHAYGGPEALVELELPDPTPGPQDLLVKVRASAVNPVDCKVRQSGMGMERPMPLVLGFDVCGEVVGLGPQVGGGFKVGDVIFASPSLARPGANAELVCVDWRCAAIKPTSISDHHAAALPLVTLTAWESLHDRARLHSGESVLIHAGGGGVGHIAIQLAKLHGCRVYTTASRESSIDLALRLGADVVINHREEDFAERINRETRGAGCAVVFDTVGDAVFDKSLDCVGAFGRLVTILPSTSPRAAEALFLKSASIHYEFMGAPSIYGVGLAHQGQILKTVAELVDAGKLTPHVSALYPLSDLAEAHRQQETGHVTGKLAISMA